MRSYALLLAVSLIATENVLAGPCKPQGSTSGEASISYGTATATILESTTLALSETTTSSDTTTTNLVALDTTTLSSDAESSTTAVTTTVPAPLGTFALRGAGGSVTNTQPQGSDQAGSLIVFNSASSSLETRHYTLETTTGRLQDAKSGNYVCAYYGDVDKASVPPYVANCDPASLGPDRLYKYLDCRVSSRKLSCTTPSTALCYYDNALRDYICAPTPENKAYDQFFYQDRGDADA